MEAGPMEKTEGLGAGKQEAEMSEPTNLKKTSSLQAAAEEESTKDDVTGSESPPAKKKKVWPAKYNKGPFICGYCGKKFRGLLDLTRHESIHTNEKPLLCQECGKGFGSDSSLRLHMFIHRNYRPHACQSPSCTAAFRTKRALQEHMVVHTDERPHKCKVCGFAMRQKSSLRKHMRIHTGERPYDCEVCGRSFSCLATCRQHQKRHDDPNSRVNLIAKKPKKKGNRVRGSRKSLPQMLTQDLVRWVKNRQMPTNLPPNMVPVAMPLNAMIPGTSASVTPSMMSSVTPSMMSSVTPSMASSVPPPMTSSVPPPMTSSVKPPIGKSINGSQAVGTSATVNGPNVPILPMTDATLRGSQVKAAPIPGQPVVFPGGLLVPVASVSFDKTAKDRNMPIHTLNANSPILVNAEHAVTFNFTPLMVIQTPFGDTKSETASSKAKTVS